MTVFFYGCITLDGYLATKERRMSGDDACQGTGMMAYSEWRGGLFRAPHLF